MPLVAGVDSSTQSTKVELRDADDGRLAGTGRAPHPVVTPPVAEQDPQAWWDALEAALAEARAAAGASTADVGAIAVAGQQHGMVALGADDGVLRPAKLWNDTTSAPDAAALVAALPGGAAAWASACGSVPVASFTVAKLAWLRRNEPDVWARLARVCLPHDWLTLRLTGRHVTDRGDASGTGYWSPAEGTYRFDLLALVDDGLDWPAMVPAVLGPAEAAGVWRPEGGGEVLVGPGTGDNMAAAVGIGLAPGDLAVSIGTSGVLTSVADSPSVDPTGTVAGFADATGRFLPLVCTLNAAKVTDAIARLLGVDGAGLDALVTEAAPGAGGLVLVPYLDGERTPNRPDATGVLAGLRSDVTQAQLARAAVEGVVCGLLDGLDALGAHNPVDDGDLWVVGGGARSAAYRQVFADLAGRPVRRSGIDEPVATGAAVQAAAVLHGRAVDEVRSAWSAVAADRTDAALTEPCLDADQAAAIRAAYAARRDRC